MLLNRANCVHFRVVKSKSMSVDWFKDIAATKRRLGDRTTRAMNGSAFHLVTIG